MIRKLHSYKLPLTNGTTRQGLIVQVGDCFGDIAPLPGFSKETFEEAEEEARRLLPFFPEAEPTLASVRFGFACAKSLIPHALSVPVSALNRCPEKFFSVKLKVGHLSLKETLYAIAQVPKGVSIRLDFNRKWTLNQLLALASHFPLSTFDYLEEPGQTRADVIAFSQKTAFPIALDESIDRKDFTSTCLEIPTLKALVVKPMILGFIPEKPPHIELIFSSVYESGVGILHLARLAQEHNPERPHGLDPYQMVAKDVLNKKPLLKEGTLVWQGGIDGLCF